MQKIDKWWDSVKEDIRIFKIACNSPGLTKYFYYPSFRALLLFRFSQLMFRWRPTKPIAYFLTVINDILTGAWIGPRVEAGPGLYLGHPRGLMVNPETKIGSYCCIMNGVTLGGPAVTIGDYVSFGAGAQIISNSRGKNKLSIGNNVIVGAGAVVVNDIPNNSIAVGVPARVVKALDKENNWLLTHMRKNKEKKSVC